MKNEEHPQLCADYTFETFATGKENKTAFETAYKAAENLEKVRSPLLLCGKNGIGKTHLLQAIGNYIFAKMQDEHKIAYFTSEKFVAEFVSSYQNEKENEFTRQFANLDVFLLDDITFLEGKADIPIELFQTIATLIENTPLTVITIDKPINELNEFYAPLIDKFRKGLIVDLAMPNCDSRISILQNKMKSAGNNISQEAIEYMAKQEWSNVREMENYFAKLVGYSELSGKPLTVQLIKQSISSNPHK